MGSAVAVGLPDGDAPDMERAPAEEIYVVHGTTVQERTTMRDVTDPLAETDDDVDDEDETCWDCPGGRGDPGCTRCRRCSYCSQWTLPADLSSGDECSTCRPICAAERAELRAERAERAEMYNASACPTD